MADEKLSNLFEFCANVSVVIKDCAFLQPAAMNMIPAQMQIPGLDMTANLHSAATEVLCLMNMVETDELMDDEEYEGNQQQLACN